MLSILNVSKPKFKAYLNQIGYKNFTAFKDEIIFEKIDSEMGEDWKN